MKSLTAVASPTRLWPTGAKLFVSIVIRAAWDSEREIDWSVSNSTSFVATPGWDEVHIAYHLLIHTAILCRDKYLRVGYLDMGPSCRRPGSIGRKEWCEVFESCFAQGTVCRDVSNRLDGPIDVSAEWSCFMRLLDELMRCAFARVHDFEVTDAEAGAVAANFFVVQASKDTFLSGRWSRPPGLLVWIILVLWACTRLARRCPDCLS